MSEDECIPVNILSIKDKAYLGALLHTSFFKRETMVDFPQGIPIELAPTQEYREKILEELLKKRVLLHKKASMENISPYDPYQNVLYAINIQDIENILPDLMYPLPLLEEHRRDAMILLREIQIYEAIEYMIETLRQFRLRVFLLEPRYTQLFLQILKTYSLGQLFNFIYTAVRNQAAYKQRSSQTYVPLANYIYKKIIERFRRAEAEGWNIIHFDRAWGWQQSELSKLVCDRLLNLDDSIFHEVIGEHSNT